MILFVLFVWLGRYPVKHPPITECAKGKYRTARSRKALIHSYDEINTTCYDIGKYYFYYIRTRHRIVNRDPIKPKKREREREIKSPGERRRMADRHRRPGYVPRTQSGSDEVRVRSI
jgi:hypothetical protein